MSKQSSWPKPRPSPGIVNTGNGQGAFAVGKFRNENKRGEGTRTAIGASNRRRPV